MNNFKTEKLFLAMFVAEHELLSEIYKEFLILNTCNKIKVTVNK